MAAGALLGARRPNVVTWGTLSRSAFFFLQVQSSELGLDSMAEAVGRICEDHRPQAPNRELLRFK